MKTPARALASLLLVAALGCSGGNPAAPDLAPPSRGAADADAGTWRYLVLAGPQQVAVPPPEPVDSAAYRSELQALAAAQRAMTDAQRTTVQEWGSGGVLRWNQLVRELVARYNLPPAPRPDGTYVFPDPANPTADPQFPFANPPYAARAYAYVSVAQYEALKVAWHYKYQYRRPAPARVDASVTALSPVGDLPAYPSEDAAVAGATEVLLRALFPGALPEIEGWGAAQREAAQLSGRAAPSDVAAGLDLGRAAGAAVLARMRADGMGAAIGNAAQWQALADRTTARGEMAWHSLETPPRPPMLPFFGNVRGWMLSTTDFEAEKPPAPPATSSAQMQADLSEVRRTVDELTREQLAIAYKWSDGVGTYAPPGHWNHIASDWLRASAFTEVRTARALALLNMAMQDAAIGCWRAKFEHFNPRPSQLDPRIKTPMGVPNFPSYTSGHSTFSAAAAVVLSYLYPSHATELAQMRDEAGISRLYGGIHYRSDIEQGKAHGERIGGYTVRFAQQDGAR